jgi:CTP synthase
VNTKTKYIVVLGTGVSGLGKGLIASSIAANITWLGYKVKMLKLDGYYNLDPGTMAPTEHGECFVTSDGLEADMDLGHFERFTGQDTTRKSSLTSGMMYNHILSKERNGEYLGKTVQTVPHVTSEIISNIKDTNCDFKVIEVGGTVGDIESNIFLEAVRQLRRREEVAVVELVYVPWLSCSKEWKTKIAQHSVSLTRSLGVEPDVLLARAEGRLPQSVLNKIERMTDVPTYLTEDLDNVYKIPMNLWNRGITERVLQHFDADFKLPEKNKKNKLWSDRVNKKVARTVNIGIAGKYENGEESYKSIVESLYHAGVEKGIKVDVSYLGKDEFENGAKDELDALIVPGGFGMRGVEEKIGWLKFARENNLPTLGICYGMQLMAIEYARNVLNIPDAYSEEWDTKKGTPIITYMTGQKKAGKGGTMRLGKQRSRVYEGLFKDIYKEDYINERHRHRLEFMATTHKEFFTGSDFKIGATSPIDGVDDRLIEAINLSEHPFYAGVQYHPEYLSRFLNPHPIFVELLRRANNV